MTIGFVLALALLLILAWRYQKMSLRCALAEQKVQTDKAEPLGEVIGKLEARMREIEGERKVDHGMVRQQMKTLLDSEMQLRDETANLVKALRTPLAKGRWGEMQLKRVVELAGMVSHCDFIEQATEGGLRPDMVVKLPGGRQVVIDAKVPLEAYLEGSEEGMKNHARQVRAHIQALSKKAYWDHFQPAPEFVVLFLPSETIFSAALQFDPSLIEAGAGQNVLIATPTTLIALLRAVSYGWKQESLSRHAEAVRELGSELYKRLVDMTDHWSRMGRALGGSVEAFNKATGSLESRVLVTARKFQEMGATASTVALPEIEPIERLPREITGITS